jgi:hypothetical protein
VSYEKGSPSGGPFFVSESRLRQKAAESRSG